MISNALYVVTWPIHTGIRQRFCVTELPVHVQPGGRPTCNQKMGNYAKALYAGLQKAFGQLLSVTPSELAGGVMPLIGTALAESRQAETALALGVPLVLVLNGISSRHGASVVQDAFGLSNRAKNTIFVVACVMPLVEMFSVMGVDKDQPLKAPVTVTYMILGRMLTNLIRDFFNEFGNGVLGDTKHVDAKGADLSKPEIMRRRGTWLVLAPFPDNVATAALSQYVVKDRLKDRFNVSSVPTDSVAELSLVEERWKDTATSSTSSGINKGGYALFSELAKAYAVNSDEDGGDLVYVNGKGLKALRDNFGPKSREAFQRWMDATCTRNLLGPVSDLIFIWAKAGGDETLVSGGASLGGGIVEMRTPGLVLRAQARRDIQRATVTVAVNLPSIGLVQQPALHPQPQPHGQPSSNQQPAGPDLGAIARQAALCVASGLASQSSGPTPTMSASAAAIRTTLTTPTQTIEETVFTVRVFTVRNTPLVPGGHGSQSTGMPSISRGSHIPLLTEPSGIEPDDPALDADLPEVEMSFLPGTAASSRPETKEGRDSPDEEPSPTARLRSLSASALPSTGGSLTPDEVD